MVTVIDTLSTSPVGDFTMPDGSPVSYDGLINTNYRLVMNKLPMTSFFLQGFTLPSINVNSVPFKTNIVDTNLIGEKINYNPFVVSFMIDSEMKNYLEIYNWMKRMTVKGTYVDEVDDITLMIGTKEMIRFIDSWPSILSGLEFTCTAETVQYIKCTLTLNYDYFNILGSPNY